MFRINAAMSGKIAAFIPGRRLMIFLLVPAAFTRGKGVSSNTVAGCHAIPICRIVRAETTKQSQVLTQLTTSQLFGLANRTA